MKKKRTLLLALVIMGVSFFYFSRQDSPLSLPLKVQKPKTASSALSSKIKVKAKEEKSEVQEDCLNTLWEKSGAKNCDDACFAKFMRDKDPEISLLIKENWLNPELTDKKPRSRIGKFYQAMLLGEVDLGKDYKTDKNFPRSIAILRNLSKDEPENSYYLFWEALILQKSGKKEEATEVLRRAAELHSYRSPFNEINHRLLTNTYKDTKAYFKGVELYASLPFPSYKQQEKLLELDEEAFLAMGKKMMEAALVHQGKFFEYTWNPLEYAIGQSFIRKVSPGEADKFPKYNELPEFEWKDVTSWDVFEKGCHEEDLKDELKKQIKDLAERT